MRQYWFRKLRYLGMMIIILLIGIGIVPNEVQGSETEKVLRVAFPQLEGFTETNEDGSRQGLVVDYLNEIAKYTGWKYEFIDTTGDDMFNEFTEGKFDLMGGTYYLPQLEEYCAYPDYNSGYSKSVLLARKDDYTIMRNNLERLAGKTIGVYENASENIRRLQQFLAINDIDCELKYYKYEDLKDGTLYPYLENGDVDLVLGNAGEINSQFRVAAYYDSQPYYIVTTPGNQEVLDGLNMALAKIVDSDPDFAEETYKANFPNIKSMEMQLSEEEIAYIQSRKKVSVAVIREWNPFYYQNEEDGKAHGLVPDVLEKVQEYTGLEFSYVFADNYLGAIELVQRGEADILGFFLGTEEDAETLGLAATKNYAIMSNVVMRNKSVSYPSDDLTGAILKGWKMPKEIKASQVQYYTDISDAVSDVNQGKVDFIYGLSINLEQEIQQHHFSNVIPVTLANVSSGTGFALKRPVDVNLMTLLNKAVNSLSSEEKTAILNQNTISIGDSEYTLSDMIYGNPVLFVTVLTSILLLILIVILLIARFRVRAVAMRAELAKAEAESTAKGEFLSRMSHEIRTPMNAVVGLTDLISMMDGVPENVRANLNKLRSSSHYLLSLLNDILDTSQLDSGMLKISKEPFSMSRMLNRLESMMIAESVRCGLHFTLEKEFTQDELSGDVIRLQQVLTNLLSNAFKFTHPGGNVSLSVMQTDLNEDGAVYSFRVKDDGTGISKEDQKRIFNEFEQVGSSYSRSQGTGLGLSISYRIVELMGGELKIRSHPGQGSEFFFTITIPVGILEDESEDRKKACLLEGMCILMAEDNNLNAEIAQQLLELQGAKVVWAKDGKQAVEMFEGSKEDEYQAILMDIQMPLMNGLEATRTIRKSAHPKAGSIPIIAMTANSFKEDTEAAATAGMNGFVAKPLDVNYLYGILYQTVHKK